VLQTSVERQLEVGIAYAQEQGFSYVVLTDRTSAYRKEVVRRDYEAILNAIRARRLKRVVSYKIDRQYLQVEELMDVIKIADRGRVPSPSSASMTRTWTCPETTDNNTMRRGRPAAARQPSYSAGARPRSLGDAIWWT
jgi:hypothetical protein